MTPIAAMSILNFAQQYPGYFTLCLVIVVYGLISIAAILAGRKLDEVDPE